MGQMGYFRRPQLAGNTLNKVRFAKVRGSRRRLDADGVSAVPYFGATVFPLPAYPALVAADTLNITITTLPLGVPTSVVATFTDNKLSTVIDAINTAVGANGLAVDEDGAVAIQTNVEGAIGYVTITGGTGAKALGFDLARGPIHASGGDMPYSPEGRIWNPASTTFPTRGENLTNDSLLKAFASLSSNSDVLFSDVAKQIASLQQVSSFTVSVDGATITPAAATRVFTGGPIASNAGSGLSVSSTKEDLAPHFFIFDTVTKQPAPGRVVSVTSNSTSWAGTSNVLGVDYVKQGSVSIVSIADGRIIELSAPLSADVVVGDMVEVTGATNYYPTNNNGIRWAISSIIDSTHIEVRPLSEAELSQMGQSFVDNHPNIELNGHRDLTQVFGSVNIHTGCFTTNVKLGIDPPLPPGGSYELWASQPASVRGDRTWGAARSNLPVSIGPQNDLDLLPNAILKAPTITNAGPDTTVGEYYVRWHGRVCRVPAHTYSPVTPGVAYWDEHTCLTSVVAIGSVGTILNDDQYPDPTSAAIASANTKGLPIAVMSSSFGGATSFAIARAEGVKNVATVGWGGDFPTIEAAVAHMGILASVNSETPSVNGPLPHFELVLLSDVSVGSVVITVPNLTIKGATPAIKLTFTSVMGFLSPVAGTLVLKDLTLKVTSSSAIALTDSFSSLLMENVTQDMSGGAKPFKVIASGFPNSSKIYISNCSLYAAGGLSWGGTGHDITLNKLTLTYASLAGVSTSQMLSPTTAASASATSIASCIVNDCSFVGYQVTQTWALFVYDNGTGKYSINNSYFSFTGSPVASSKLFYLTGPSLNMTGCKVDGQAGASTIGYVVQSSSSIVHLTNCVLEMKPQGSYGVNATSVTNCNVTCYDGPSSAALGAIDVTDIASGNYVSGVVQVGISGHAASRIIGNKVDIVSGGSTTASHPVSTIGSVVLGNHLNNQSTARCITASAVSNMMIGGNKCSSTGAGQVINVFGSDVHIYGNDVVNSTGSVVVAYGIAVTSGLNTNIFGNNVKILVSGSYGGIGIYASNSAIYMSNNYVYASEPIQQVGAQPLFAVGNFLDGDIYTASGTFTGNRIRGRVTFTGSSTLSNNTFLALSAGSGGVYITHTNALDVSTVTGNIFTGYDGSSFCFKFSSSAASACTVGDNRFYNQVDLQPGAGGSLTFSDNIEIGYLSVTLTGAGTDAVFTGNILKGTSTTISLGNSASPNIVFTSNKANAITVAVGTAPAGHILIDSCYFTLGALVADVGNGCTFSNNIVDGFLALTQADISSCISSGTATLAQCTVASSTISDTTTVTGNCYFSNSFLSAISNTAQWDLKITNCNVNGTLTSDGYTNVSDSYISGAAVIGKAGSTFPSVVNPAEVYISGSTFVGALTVSGNISLSDVRCGGDLTTADLSLVIGAVGHEFRAANLVCKAVTVTSMKLKTCATIDISSVSCLGDMTLEGNTHVKATDVSSLSYTITTSTSSGVTQLTNITGSGNITATTERFFAQSVRMTSFVNVTAKTVHMDGVHSGGTLTATLSLGTVLESAIEKSSCSTLVVTAVSTQSVSVRGLRTTSTASVSGCTYISVDSSVINGALKVEPTTSSDSVSITNTSVIGNIEGTSSANVKAKLKLTDSVLVGGVSTATGNKVKILNCTLQYFTAHGTGGTPTSDSDITGCVFATSPVGSGQIYIDSANGISCNISGCDLNSILLDGLVHDVIIRGNKIDGAYNGGAPPIYIIDGDDLSRVEIVGNIIKTHGANSGGSGFGCITIGVIDLPAWPSPSGVIIPNLSIDSNVLVDVGGPVGLDYIKFTARVIDGTISNNKILVNNGATGNYIKLECGGTNNQATQCNNIVLSGNIFARLNADGKNYVAYGDRQFYISYSGGGYRTPGLGDAVLMGTNQTKYPNAGGTDQYQVYIPIT